MVKYPDVVLMHPSLCNNWLPRAMNFSGYTGSLVAFAHTLWNAEVAEKVTDRWGHKCLQWRACWRFTRAVKVQLFLHDRTCPWIKGICMGMIKPLNIPLRLMDAYITTIAHLFMQRCLRQLQTLLMYQKLTDRILQPLKEIHSLPCMPKSII